MAKVSAWIESLELSLVGAVRRICNPPHNAFRQMSSLSVFDASIEDRHPVLFAQPEAEHRDGEADHPTKRMGLRPKSEAQT
jgi:hypothetical protein